MYINRPDEFGRALTVVAAVLMCVALIPVYASEAAGPEQADPKWITEEQAEVIEQFDRRQRMHGRDDIVLRSIAEGDSALVYKIVIDDLMAVDGLSLDALSLDKYHVIYGLRGDHSLVYFSIRDDAHDQVGLTDSDGEFIKRMTNYPYIEYWIDRQTWKIVGRSEHPF